jgi:hypothetical protein
VCSPSTLEIEVCWLLSNFAFKFQAAPLHDGLIGEFWPHVPLTTLTTVYTDEAMSDEEILRKFNLEVEETRASECTSCLFECVQVPAGVRAVHPLFITTLLDFCGKHKIPTIADETFTGCGRSGLGFFAFESYRVLPDAVTMGKVLPPCVAFRQGSPLKFNQRITTIHSWVRVEHIRVFVFFSHKCFTAIQELLKGAAILELLHTSGLLSRNRPAALGEIFKAKVPHSRVYGECRSVPFSQLCLSDVSSFNPALPLTYSNPLSPPDFLPARAFPQGVSRSYPLTTHCLM